MVELMLKKMNTSKYSLWWYKNDEDKYKRMVNDKNVDEIYKYAIETKCVMNLYVDHFMKDIIRINVEEDEKGDGVNNVEEEEQEDEQGDGGINVEEDEQSDVSDYEATGITFDDNEKDMALVLDDGFDINDKEGDGNGKKGRVKCVTKKHKHTPKKYVNGVDNIGSSSCVDNNMEINYASDDLGSKDPNDLDNEKVGTKIMRRL
ncbi:unnamed protein product [Vicia faba]|uniref:Uncharacterized protein n=1 Tax=Vicia faba TaxID=3906 RepID=A0AAV0ZMM8_VICFA|nr:unnamed protein product [Vicia faba]